MTLDIKLRNVEEEIQPREGRVKGRGGIAHNFQVHL
jgi:hypothetical protein